PGWAAHTSCLDIVPVRATTSPHGWERAGPGARLRGRGAWRSLVAHQSGGLVVVGSNPAAPTTFPVRNRLPGGSLPESDSNGGNNRGSANNADRSGAPDRRRGLGRHTETFRGTHNR